MGVNLKVYGIFGIKTTDREIYDKINYINDLDYMDDEPTADMSEQMTKASELLGICSFLQDGYCGEYSIIGTQIYSSGDFRYGWDETENNKTYSIKELLELEIKQKELLKYFGIEIDEPFHFFGIKHYS